MKEIEITVEVRCLNKAKIPSSYRIYVDNDLITERTFIWTNEFIKEHMFVSLGVGEHSVRLEPVDPDFKGFFMSSPRIDGKVVGDANNVFTLE